MYAASNSDYDFDVEYLPSLCTKRFREHPDYHERILTNFEQVTGNETRRVREKYKVRLDVRYGGDNDNQLLDIYYKDKETDGTPIFVYIHGGYWQLFDKSTAGSFVAPLVEAGYRVLVVDYNLCPQVTLAQLMQQIGDFFQWLQVYAQHTAAPSVCVAGHSAGAHLVTVLLQQPPIERLTNVFLISGVYDLRELYKLACANDKNILSLDARIAEDLSPICWPKPAESFGIGTRWHVLVGQHESATFIGQSRAYAKKLEAAGLLVDFQIMNYDHFDIIETVPEEGSEINRYLKAVLWL